MVTGFESREIAAYSETVNASSLRFCPDCPIFCTYLQKSTIQNQNYLDIVD